MWTLLIATIAKIHPSRRGLGFGVWGLGFGVWGLGRRPRARRRSRRARGAAPSRGRGPSPASPPPRSRGRRARGGSRRPGGRGRGCPHSLIRWRFGEGENSNMLFDGFVQHHLSLRCKCLNGRLHFWHYLCQGCFHHLRVVAKFLQDLFERKTCLHFKRETQKLFSKSSFKH